MTREKFLPILAHGTGWLLFFGLLAGFLYNANPDMSIFSLLLNPVFILFGILYISSYYFNTLVLVPFLYLRKKYLLYFSIILVLLLLVAIFKPFDRLIHEYSSISRMPIPGSQPPPGFKDIPGLGPMRLPPSGRNQSIFKTDILSIVLYVMVMALGLALCMIREWRITEQRALKAEAERAQAELSFLKAQINPHFLFNTLNNIYSMVVIRHDKAADAVMKLSGIMRYITDEIRTDLVPLESEVGCVVDYVELQRMRLGAGTDVQVSITGHTGGEQIAPLLLMTFVENAFKYGISNHEPAPIEIRLEATESVIRFYCRNKLFPKQAHTERAGIGISNARRRLEHLYPDRYKLEISKADGFYTVQLILQSH